MLLFVNDQRADSLPRMQASSLQPRPGLARRGRRRSRARRLAGPAQAYRRTCLSWGRPSGKTQAEV